MTEEQLRAIKARREAIDADIDAPLEVREGKNKDGNYTVAAGYGWIADAYTPEIAAFIAAAPSDIAALLVEAEQQRARAAAAEEQLAQVDAYVQYAVHALQHQYTAMSFWEWLDRDEVQE